jgi:hypothetical protein
MDSKQDPELADQKATVEAVEDPQKHATQEENLHRKDRAAELLQNANEPVVVAEADNKRILKKIDLTILPIMLGVYFLQQLDKSTLSYASVFGLVKNAHLGGQDYSWLGSIVYVAQLVMQPIVAYFLVKLPTGKFAAVMVLCWGIVLSCMSIAKNFKGLLAARFFLGCFEASVGKAHFVSRNHDTNSPSSNFCSNHSDVVAESRADQPKRILVCHERRHKHGEFQVLILDVGTDCFRLAAFWPGL